MEASARMSECQQKENPVFVVIAVGDGFDVYKPENPDVVHRVTGNPESPECTCADYQWRGSKSGVPCDHIKAVFRYVAPANGQRESQESESNRLGSQAEPDTASNGSFEIDGAPSLLGLKRSVSLDGRINSLSVEMTLPIQGLTPEMAQRNAAKALRLQEAVARQFLAQGDGHSANGDPGHETGNGNGTRPAYLRDIGGMQTRNGWRYIVNVEIDGQTYKLFGTRRQVSDQLRNAGHARFSDQVNKGTRLNVPCRAVLESSEDGRYVNVVELLPVQTGSGNGR
ncbi:MAG: hypothetical protein AMXMBFR84_42390 [Candidatus Hydrogenedentota bacterium]